MSSTTVETVRIRELDVDMIPPTTATYKELEQGGSKIVVVGKPGTGKCLAPGTRVMMYDGTIRKVEDIIVGDQLMGDDSTPRIVLSTCNGRDKMYEITQKNGDKYTVNAPHMLSLVSNIKRKGDKIDISVEEFIRKSKDFQKSYCGYKVGVEFQPSHVDLDPYLLGYWIGGVLPPVNDERWPPEFRADDTLITTSDEVLVYFNQKLTELGLYSKQDPISDPIMNFLRDNDLLKNKHIPKNYKINDRQVRLEILAGILDADGWYDPIGNTYDFVQKNEVVIDDIIFISRSLGFSVNKKECFKFFVCKGETKQYKCFSCQISGDVHEIPVKIISNKARPRKSNKNHLASRISIKYVGEGEYYGFQLDGNHRFLLGDFTVTHNTTLIASLLYAKKHIFPVGVAFSGTEDSNHFYRSVMPSTFVFNSYDEEQLEKFIKRQKIARDHLENPWAVVILDDCTDDPALFRKPLQNGMYKRGRHWKMWYILSLQYGMDVRPVIRTNIDGVFILREPNMRNRRVMYENYASIIPDFKLFCDIMDQITNDYTALYIHNAKQTNSWQDCVFWYKAKPVPKDFKFGSEDYWNFHYQRYNPEYVDPITV